MKLTVIGIGQCGGRVADEFARLNKRARSLRGIEIITGAFAVNTDSADLKGLSTIKADNQHRILLGGEKTRGHGVAKMNKLAAEIARADSYKVIDTIKTTKKFPETDAFLLVAGAAGGTGSGVTPIMIQYIKERYINKPVYALIVLPFEYEGHADKITIYNTDTCLKSIYSIADAVILVDNQQYIRKNLSLRNNVVKINELIVEPFYNMLCAGEERKAKHVGTKVLDTGDIIETLVGWTAIGYGKSLLPLIRLPFERTRNFRKKGIETHRGIQAMDEAISELSVQCKPEDAGRALYLISAPAEELNVDMISELNDYLHRITSEAVIRSGDYPQDKGLMDLVVVLSEFRDLEKVTDYHIRSEDIGEEISKMQNADLTRLSITEEASKDIPSLI